MRLFACLAALAAVSSIPAQKLETQSPNTTKVIRVETARDHLTVIEVADAVTMVAVGNQNAYTVEWRENKVLVRPAEDDARTNLFIWTRAGRFAYELVPAASVDQMHFAVDQPTRVVAAKIEQPQPATEMAQKQAPLPAEMLIHATPLPVHGQRDTRGRVEVTLRELYRREGRLYLRYAISNRSSSGYHPARPAVWRMADVQSAISLIPFRDGQLGERLARSVKSSMLAPVKVLDADQSAHVAAWEDGAGWLIIEQPATSGDSTAVLRIEFAADARGSVYAVLALKPTNVRTEVADSGAVQQPSSPTGNR